MNHINIMIVDDDPDDQELIQEAILEVQKSATFTNVHNGNLALEILNSIDDLDLPDLIILDYNMPTSSGAQVLTQLSQHPRYQKIPKVILSTSKGERFIKQCIDNGATDYFVKPGAVDELKQFAKHVLKYIQKNI